jgi:hypothetical protein
MSARNGIIWLMKKTRERGKEFLGYIKYMEFVE